MYRATWVHLPEGDDSLCCPSVILCETDHFYIADLSVISSPSIFGSGNLNLTDRVSTFT